MAGSYKADHGMIKWSLKFVCQYDHNIDRSIATYTDHIKIMSYWGFKEHTSCWKVQNIVFICCLKMPISSFNIWVVNFANYCWDHICLTDICGDLSFCPSKMTIKCFYSEMEAYIKVILFYYLSLLDASFNTTIFQSVFTLV